MTTHIVEIRPSKKRGGGEWHPLTLAPITKHDADRLSSVIGPHWEARVVVDTAISPASREFADFEALANLVRWSPRELVHHPSCKDYDREAWSTHTLGDKEGDIMTATEWFAERSAAKAAVGSSFSVGRPIVHLGKCEACGAACRHLSIKVTIGNRTREYAL